MTPLWLLPGMDGTGRLFAPLVPFVREGFEARVCAYPRGAGSYETCERALGPPPDGAVLVGESFGGPLALRLAQRSRPKAVVLVASFVTPPRRLRPPSWLPLPTPPRWAIRMALVGRDAPETLVSAVAAAIAEADGRVMAARVAAIARLDDRALLASCPAPVTLLVARRDRLVPRHIADAARAARPSLRVQEIDGPHLLAQRVPAEVADAIRRAAR